MRRSDYYFAFGSNIHAGQMALRCPDAVFIGIYALNGWRFAFSPEHRGANVFQTDQPDDVVWGAVYRLTEADEQVLDKYEGRYQKIYVAHPEFTDVELMLYQVPNCQGETQPYQDYHERIVEALRARGVCADYIAYVEGVGNLGFDHPERNYRGNSDGLR